MENFGKKLKLTENKKDKGLKDKVIFIQVVESLEKLMNRSILLMSNFGLDLFDFENGYNEVIDNLFLLKFGPIRTELVLWYLYEREVDEDGNSTPLIVETEDKQLVEVIIKDISQLWDFMEKVKLK